MKKCRACNIDIDDDSVYCKKCGANQNEMQEKSVGVLIDKIVDTTAHVTKKIAKETIKVSKEVAKKVKDEIDKE